MGAAVTFLEAYDRHRDSLLDRIITGDDTWTKKLFANFVTKEDYGDCVWDRQGVLLIDFLECVVTINSERYGQTLRNLRRAVQNKRRRQLTSKILLLHDNVRPHTANCTQELLNLFKWEVFPHPPYSPYLAPSDFHLFLRMKNWLATQRFDGDKGLRVRVTEWLRWQASWVCNPPLISENRDKSSRREDDKPNGEMAKGMRGFEAP
ncbi:mariner Mos1 transposase [Trichonephila clavipes]|nr:mariner Mos1 transposase [Trichonephila clavipes]